MNALSAQEVVDKIPPQNIEAEMAVLGSMLLDENVIPEVLEIVDEGSFYKTEHQVVFCSIVSLFDNRRKVDILTISEDLNKNKLLEKGGCSGKNVER